MSATALRHYQIQHRDDQHSSQPLAVDPRCLDIRTMHEVAFPELAPHESVVTSPHNQSTCPGHSLSPLPPRADVWRCPSSSELPPRHDPSTGGRDDETFSSTPGIDPTYSIPLWQNEDLLTHDNFLRDPTPPRGGTVEPDSTWENYVVMPRCSSPTSFSQPLPPDGTLPNGELGYQTHSSSIQGSGTPKTSRSHISAAPGVTREVPQRSISCHSQTAVGSVPVLPQRRYQPRRSSGTLSGESPQVIQFWPHGYPVSSVHKGKKLEGLPNAQKRAFPDVVVGQKLSWRFLFDGCMESARQFNVLDVGGTQPTVERIVRETVKALKRFKGREPRFIYPLHRLVILQIELVSCASVQATIGVLSEEDVTTRAHHAYVAHM